MAIGRRGLIIILSSPSGAGKTTLTRMLLQDKALDLTLSVSVTVTWIGLAAANGAGEVFVVTAVGPAGPAAVLAHATSNRPINARRAVIPGAGLHRARP